MATGRLGRYRLLSELGSGGMGTVYLAEERDGTKVALKVVHPHLMRSPGFIKSVTREGELGRRIRHENVVATFDVDGVEVDGKTSLFLAMEYVEGQTLRHLLDELGRVPEELCRHIGREVATGLAAIHAAGVVHRDLKPENILITPDHAVKVMDLGVARLVDEAVRLSEVGWFAGSVLYAAPEQFVGQNVDARSDLYALGLVLYELATGQHPFTGTEAAVIMTRKIQEDARPASELNPQLSPFFEEVLTALLARDPDRRLASAAELGRILRQGEHSTWWRARATAIRIQTKRPLRRIRIPRETALYGRDDDLGKLRELYDRAKAGEGQVVLLEGEAGIGKTRLVDEFVGRLRQEGEDLNFLFGSYPPGGAATSAGAFATAYREQFGTEGLEETLRDYLGDMPALVPAFAALLRQEPPPGGAEPLGKESLQTAFVAATRVLATERPTIVLVDDLHFAPEEGRALLAALALAVPGHAILLVGTARPGLPPEWVAGVERLDHATRRTLSRLGPKDLGALLVEAFGSPRLAEELGFQIATKSDGNPFFAFEIIRGLREGQLIAQRADGTWIRAQAIEHIQTPASVLDLIHARIADLDEADKDLLDVASCCGFEFDPSLVGDAVGMARIPVLKRLGRIERTHRLIRSVGLKFTFDHHQVQEALYDALPGMLRQEYHAALGAALERREGAADRDPRQLDGRVAAALCDHLLKGGRGSSARRYLMPALDHLERHYLNGAEIRVAEQALEDPGLLEGRERVEVLLRLADRLYLLGRRGPERKALDEALALADGTGEALLRARVRRSLGVHLWRLSRYDEAGRLLGEARDLAHDAGNRKLEARAAGDLGNVLLHLGRYGEARKHYQRQLALSSEVGDRRGEGRALGNLGVVAINLGRHDEAREPLQRALELAREIGDRRGEALANQNLAALFICLGRYELAEPHLERQLDLARAVGKRQSEADAVANAGFLSLQLGRYAEARDRFHRHLELALEVGERRAAAIALLNVGSLECALGELASAEETLDQALAVLRELGARQWAGRVLHCLGTVAEYRSDLERAARRYEEALAIRREVGHRNGVANTLVALGRVEAARGHEEAAIGHLDEAVDLGRALHAPGTTLCAVVQRSLLSGGDRQAAIATLAECRECVSVDVRMEACFRLGTATGDAMYIEEAYRLLVRMVEHAPRESRQSMTENVPLHREIAAAWERQAARAR